MWKVKKTDDALLGVGVVFALFNCRDQVGAASYHRRISKNHAKRDLRINAQVPWGKCGRLKVLRLRVAYERFFEKQEIWTFPQFFFALRGAIFNRYEGRNRSIADG
jgi:hypothetical protein